MLSQLIKTDCSDFLEDVKRQRRKWVKDSAKCDPGQCCVEMTNLYVNYKATGLWDKSDVSSQQSIITLATALKKEHAKNKQKKGTEITASTGCERTPTGGGGKSRLPAWRITKVGKTFTSANGSDFVWCNQHGQRTKDGKLQGLYMPDGHDNDTWAVERAARATAFKLKMQEIKAAKRTAPHTKQPGKKSKYGGK